VAKIRLRFHRVAAVLLGLGLACLLGEIGLHLAHVLPAQRNPLSGFHEADQRLGWKGSPDLEARFVRPEFDVVIRHGADGFRLAAPPTPSAGRELAVLGDSFVWGWGVEQGEVVTDHLARLLARPVRNLGLNAAGTAQEVLILEAYAQTADDALLLFFHNDLRDNTDRRRGERPVLRAGQTGLVLEPPSRRRRGALFRGSRLLSLVRLQVDRVLAARRRGAPGIPVCDAPSEWELEELLLRRGASAGPRLHLAYVPTAAEVGAASSCRDGLETLGESLGLPVLDLGPGLGEQCSEGHGPGAPCYYALDGHWTARGHRIAAELLADWLAG
jgi:hypothetical protein